MERVFRTLTRCLVCGFAEVRTDEVIDHGVVFLAECPRCEHRWTSRVPATPRPAAVARIHSPEPREVASAA
jgi:transcription elongation factor Elf1